ncbi:hypothetical protein B0T24DRAFT_694844 [Lasiosphaeria ovina]|uniref:Protein kinase domain-containing protein n=1 Tax=Lasiosphaeria ovina TaxID=92902 RepID=A0AAE0KN21_9PEZI|nr:hypothetical protein B0T24DRAFT_694844 [Lasiosphaeria ovina]
MADPVSALGLLGLFNVCLEGYKVCLAVKDANNDFTVLRWRMFHQRERFVNVCAALGLPAFHSNDDPKADALRRYMEHDEFRRRGVEGTLRAIALLLERAEKADRKYSSPAGNISGGVSQMRIRDRVPWSIRDKAAYEEALVHLADYNESLEKVLPVSIQRFLDTVLPATICATDEEAPQQTAPTSNAFLESQVRWKHSVCGVGGIVLGNKLDLQSLNMEGKPVGKATPDRYLAIPSSTPGHVLVVDWLPWMEPSADVADRVSRSSGLLANVQRPELLLLPCAGYLEEFAKRHDKWRYALAYRLPQDPIIAATTTPSTLPGTHNLKVHSLGQLLQPKQVVLPPPLDVRLDIARKLCRAMVLYHSSDWVHHDFRSHNILFIQPSAVTTEITSRTTQPSMTTYQGVRIDQPFIVGFGHARDEVDTSTAFQDKKAISQTLAQQRLYWSPSYLASSGKMKRVEHFQRKHDVYSLGCVLLEIGTWKSLETFTWSKKYEEDHGKWHQRLMDEGEKLRALCGGREDVQKLAFDVLLGLEEVVV